jgi:hypothetical protein
MKLFNSKKGVGLNDFPSLAILFVVAAITLGLGATILTNVQNGQTANSIAYNASGYGLTSVNTLSQWTPTIAIVVAAAVIIGVVSTFLMMRRQ